MTYRDRLPQLDGRRFLTNAGIETVELDNGEQ